MTIINLLIIPLLAIINLNAPKLILIRIEFLKINRIWIPHRNKILFISRPLQHMFLLARRHPAVENLVVLLVRSHSDQLVGQHAVHQVLAVVR
jgi:hypothetical protein